MGSLLDQGIEPSDLRWFDALCSSGNHLVRVTPFDVWQLLE
jgi:hypothetical protein